MNTLRTIFLFLPLFFFYSQNNNGQSLSPATLSSAGNYQENKSSLSWTMGQTAIETFSSDTLYLTQGFQQEISLEVTPVDTAPNSLSENFPFNIQVYPNPVDGLLQVEILDKTPGELGFRLFTADGQLVKTGEQFLSQTSINFSGYKAGLYFLHVIYNDKSRVYKIVKHR